MKRAPAAAAILHVILLLNLSCGNSDDELSVSTPGVPNVILPLQVGNTWIYQRSSFDTQGSIIAQDTLTQRIARDTLISGERWYIWETPFGLSMGTLRSDGYWTYVGGEPALALHYPASRNETYKLTESGPVVHVLAVDTLITVPFGTFACIAYEQLSSLDGRRARIDFCTANTGVIRVDEFVPARSGEDSLSRRSDLVDLHVH
jgi:hypothetical protein